MLGPGLAQAVSGAGWALNAKDSTEPSGVLEPQPCVLVLCPPCVCMCVPAHACVWVGGSVPVPLGPAV